MNAPTDLHLKALDAARNRVANAKAAFTAACEAAQQQDPSAGQRCGEALEELNAARAELRQLTDQAPGEWAIAARARDE
jgi:hypothetical protein